MVLYRPRFGAFDPVAFSVHSFLERSYRVTAVVCHFDSVHGKFAGKGDLVCFGDQRSFPHVPLKLTLYYQ